MLKALTICAVALTLTSCAIDLPGVVREAAKDHASVHVEINTIYGRVVYDRSNPKPTPVAH
jgi:hypothetical protein